MTQRRGAVKLSAPVAIVIVVIAAIALYFSFAKSGFFVQHGNLPLGPPSNAMKGGKAGAGTAGGTAGGAATAGSPGGAAPAGGANSRGYPFDTAVLGSSGGESG